MRRINVFVKDINMSGVVHETSEPFPLRVNKNGVLEIKLDEGSTANYPLHAIWCWTEEKVS
jgi:hypothetical protein